MPASGKRISVALDKKAAHQEQVLTYRGQLVKRREREAERSNS